ncbi:MAG: hypothetical protein IT177_02495 [Acidobacteria bacterium]|nr:hypothetical protein [Acidobacteriota bacterium]
MTPHRPSHPRPGGERGMALVSALLLLLVMSGLAIALTASGRIEVAMGDNEELYAGARAAAESGLNRAAAQIMALTANPAYPLNNLLLGPDGDAADTADNGLMMHLADMAGSSPCPHPNGPCWFVAPGSPYRYNVRLYDDDDPAMKGGIAFTNAELTAMGPPPDPPEDGTGVTDVNRRIVIRATGFGPQGTTATLEQMLTPIKMPALLVDGDLEMFGSVNIIGSQGSVHANGNLDIDGMSGLTVSQNATASGTLTANAGWDPGGLESGGMPEIPVPDIFADDYFDDADFVLHGNVLPDGTPDTPRITNKDGTTTYCLPGGGGDGCRGVTPSGGTGPFGFRYNAASNTWDLNPQGSGNNTNWATYFAYTDVKITGNPGTTSSPILLTIIAEGNIEVTGNPDLRPEPLSEVQFVTEKDLRIAGNISIPTAFEGRIMVREQIDFGGSASLAGQVIVQDVPSVSTLVENNRVHGTVTLSYNGLIETVAYTVSGWRETP